MNTSDAVKRINGYVDAQLAIGAWMEMNDLVSAIRHVVREARINENHVPVGHVSMEELNAVKSQIYDLKIALQKANEKRAASDKISFDEARILVRKVYRSMPEPRNVEDFTGRMAEAICADYVRKSC